MRIIYLMIDLTIPSSYLNKVNIDGKVSIEEILTKKVKTTI